MHKFVCTDCGQVWYSAADVGTPCADCGGAVAAADQCAAAPQ